MIQLPAGGFHTVNQTTRFICDAARQCILTCTLCYEYMYGCCLLHHWVLIRDVIAMWYDRTTDLLYAFGFIAIYFFSKIRINAAIFLWIRDLNLVVLVILCFCKKNNQGLDDVFLYMGLLRKIAGCACTGNAGNLFIRHRLQRKPIVSDPGMHHGTCVKHVSWCMSGSLTRGENVPSIPGACTTRNFTYLARGPRGAIWHNMQLDTSASLSSTLLYHMW